LLARWFAELFFDPEDGGDTSGTNLWTTRRHIPEDDTLLTFYVPLVILSKRHNSTMAETELPFIKKFIFTITQILILYCDVHAVDNMAFVYNSY
jgi:hypothetical protein